MIAKQSATSPYNLITPAAQANPYPIYQQMQAEAPVYWHDAFNAWFITRYADVHTLLRHPAVITKAQMKDQARHLQMPEELREKMLTIGEFISHWLIVVPPEDHRRLRKLLNKGFTPKLVQALQPRIQTIADELIDQFVDADQVDLMDAFAYPLPALVIAEMLGLPAGDRHLFRSWSKKMFAFFNVRRTGDLSVIDAMHETLEEMKAYLRDIVAARRQEPQDDIITSLLAKDEQGDQLSETALLSNCVLMFFAGHETTTNLIGNGMLALLQQSGALCKLCADVSLMSTAVEEFLRYDSPTQLANRTTTADINVGGQQIQAGQNVMLCLGAANRDPAQFANPDQLDITRSPNAHLTFGQGTHFCLGAPLARLEADIAFQTLLRRLVSLQLTDQPITWQKGFGLRGLETLPVTFEQILH